MAPKTRRQLNYDNLELGLELKLTSAGSDETANHYLLVAAYWFEKNARVDPTTSIQDRYLAALAYYLTGHYAQAYVLFRDTTSIPDPQIAYRLLRRLFAKELAEIEGDANVIWVHL